jgi:hypothetical protein
VQLPAPRPALKEIVSEAARALARLDADRLEELALSCRALNRELTCDQTRDVTGDVTGDGPGVSNRDASSGSPPIKETERARLAAEAGAARGDMAIFAGVLEATRANVQVIERLRELRSGSIEYSIGQAIDFDRRWPSKEIGPGKSRPGDTRHGND